MSIPDNTFRAGRTYTFRLRYLVQNWDRDVIPAGFNKDVWMRAITQWIEGSYNAPAGWAGNRVKWGTVKSIQLQVNKASVLPDSIDCELVVDFVRDAPIGTVTAAPIILGAGNYVYSFNPPGGINECCWWAVKRLALPAQLVGITSDVLTRVDLWQTGGVANNIPYCIETTTIKESDKILPSSSSDGLVWPVLRAINDVESTNAHLDQGSPLGNAFREQGLDPTSLLPSEWPSWTRYLLVGGLAVVAVVAVVGVGKVLKGAVT